MINFNFFIGLPSFVSRTLWEKSGKTPFPGKCTDKTTNCDVDLWQTPTFITWMCLSYNPETKEPDGGHEGVRRRYLEWVKSHTNGVWKDKEDLDRMREK